MFARVTFVFLAFLVAGCQQRLQEYTPIIDTAGLDQAQFEYDLSQCRTLAERVQEEYRAEQQNKALGNAIAGAIVGVALGAAVGSVSADAGAGALVGGATGAAVGAANANAENQELIEDQPRRILDRCMKNRGYAILNDVGRGLQRQSDAF